MLFANHRHDAVTSCSASVNANVLYLLSCRYAPGVETPMFHFHQLLARALSAE